DSLTAFAGVGDEIRLEPADTFTLSIEGPRAEALQDEPIETNLVFKVAQTLSEKAGKPLKSKMTLIKNLPVASGIGGGSSDAAAAIRALAIHWGIKSDDPQLMRAAAQHGQDVPVCLEIENCYITEHGVEEGPQLPLCHIVLVNPGKALPTPAVYKAY